MTSWLETFRSKKPVIAMAHIPALPGTPRYDTTGGIARLIECVRADVTRLVQGV